MTDLYHDIYSDTYGDAMTVTLGVDVSSYQGSIDWAAVARTPYRFGICRMTIGRSTLDNLGRRNLQAILDTMPIAGGYGVVGIAEPVEDGAKQLLDEIVMAGGDPARLLVMLDAEDFGDGSHPTIDQVDRYARQLHADLGRWPVAYVPDWWLDKYGYTVAGRGLANCPWAPSEYFPAPWTEARLLAHKPASLHGFKTLGWLQYTSLATIAGISGNVDANCFFGSVDQLRSQLIGGTVSAQGPASWDTEDWKAFRSNSTVPVVRLLDHNDEAAAGNGNNHKVIRTDLADLRTELTTDLQTVLDTVKAIAPGELSPQQISDLGSAIADRLAVLGVAYTGTIDLTPKAVP